jgi:hypothetical protein
MIVDVHLKKPGVKLRWIMGWTARSGDKRYRREVVVKGIVRIAFVLLI